MITANEHQSKISYLLSVSHLGSFLSIYVLVHKIVMSQSGQYLFPNSPDTKDRNIVPVYLMIVLFLDCFFLKTVVCATYWVI